MANHTYRLPAEWEAQDAVLIAWPHADSDWAPLLDEVNEVYVNLSREILRFAKLIILTDQQEQIRQQLVAAGIQLANLYFCPAPTNDTWARDFGPITVYREGTPVLLDFGFNGWGLKFASDRDNQTTRILTDSGILASLERKIPGLILEGGSIESDGRGTLLTTSECLLNPNRNPHLNREQLEQQLSPLLGCDHWLWLDHGYLAGDDTDSHIDTLARLCPNDTILYVQCDDQQDEHYPALKQMEEQLASFRTREGQPFRLIPLPWPDACYDEEERLPATYANFLIINDAVLVPTYADANDHKALQAVAEAFPDREIIGIDCRPLIRQHGSLHCITMQLPQGVLP